MEDQNKKTVSPFSEGWNPIELLSDHKGHVLFGWIDHKGVWIGGKDSRGYYCAANDTKFYFVDSPTHFMLLPSPPSNIKG